MPDTHVVTNQVPPLENYNPATSPVLTEALIREGGEWGLDEVTELGALSGSRQAQRWGELADRNQPILRTHDRYGHRVDEVEYDPAYHELMKVAIGHGLHAAPWADDRPGAHVVRAAKIVGVDARTRPHLPDLDDVRRRSRAAQQPRAGGGLRAAADQSRATTPSSKVPATKVRHHRGHVDDREAGRLRRPRRHHAGHAERRRQLQPHRPQVVHVGADVRRLPRAGPGAGRADAASSCRGCCPTAAATGCSCSGSRTSWATTPTPRSEVEYDGATAWLVGERAAACRPSSRWSTSPGWTARWAAPPACAAV